MPMGMAVADGVGDWRWCDSGKAFKTLASKVVAARVERNDAELKKVAGIGGGEVLEVGHESKARGQVMAFVVRFE